MINQHKIVFMLLITFIFSGCSSMISEATNQEMNHHFEISYTDTIQRNKEVLFDKTLTWVVTTFRSAKSVIDFQDKSLGLLKINAIGEEQNLEFKYLMISKISDNKIIFDFSDLVPYFNNEPYPSLSRAKGLHKKAHGHFIQMVNAIKRYNL